MGAAGAAFQLSYPDYTYYRDHARAFADLAAHYSTSPMNVVTPDGPFNVSGQRGHGQLLRACCACSRRWAASSCRTKIACRAGIRSPSSATTCGGRDSAGTPASSARACASTAPPSPWSALPPNGFHGILSGLPPNDVWIPSAMFGVGYRYCDGLARGCNVVGLVGRLNEARLDSRTPRRRWTCWRASSNPRIPTPTEAGVSRCARPAASGSRSSCEDAPIVALLAGARRARADHRVGQRRRAVARPRPAAPEGDRDPARARRQPGRLIRLLLVESVALALAGSVAGLVVAIWSTGVLRGFFGARVGGTRSTSISRSTCASCWRASASRSSPAC